MSCRRRIRIKMDWLPDDPSNENWPVPDFLVSDIESVLGTSVFTD